MEFMGETPRLLSKNATFSEETEDIMTPLPIDRRGSQLSDASVQTPSSSSMKRVSIAAGAQRRFSRSIYNYVSPYSKWKSPPSSVEEKPKEEEQLTKENTYRMEPKIKLPEGEIRSILQHNLTSALAMEKYNGRRCGVLTKLLSARILAQVKDLDIERYKLVCFVNITSKHRQGMRVVSRCLWNPEVDTVVSATFENSSLVAVANVYGVYLE